MKLFEQVKLGFIELQNRIVMAPMTRNRAIGNLPNELMVAYYAQRAGAGLIITEGTSPSPNGLGYPRIPGLFSAEQCAGWRMVTTAVHARGGRIFAQIMHTGRVGSLLNLPAGAKMLAPSRVPVSGKIWTDVQGEQPYDMPAEMTQLEIRQTVNEYVHAARNAMAAGFDGVELHGANGYMINQFLDPASNCRMDAYGRDATGRNRFAQEIAAAVIAVVGAERVGIRLSPYGVFNDMSGAYGGIAEQYLDLAAALGRFGMLYLHLVDHSSMGAPKPLPATVQALCRKFRASGGRAIILSGGYDRARAEADLAKGDANLIAFGRPFISNPDLADRLREDSPLAQPEMTTFYTPGPEGYTDYPALESH